MVKERTSVSSNVIRSVIPNKKLVQTNVDDGIVEYMEALEEIDENSPLAELNAVSISDNNGGRIFL
ncbi:MAG: hypothetical protein M3Q79_03035 [bacterium]|nr:hypothetical protein [bacterium]